MNNVHKFPTRIHRVMPNLAQLQNMPLARHHEFELSEKETKHTRQLIYSINSGGVFRYRTMRDGNILLVWRIK